MIPEIDIRILGADDAKILAHASPDVFDGIISPHWTQEFLADPRHHLAVALHDGVVVGMASAVHYVHPDKAPELWINEVGVAATHQRSGIARRLLDALFARGRALGCQKAWVATEVSNAPAQRLYASAGGKTAQEPFLMFDFDLGAPSS
jgi:ribosomal protein S18 acetylase RimI-like enzyme